MLPRAAALRSKAPKVRKNLEGYLVPKIEKALKKADKEIEKAIGMLHADFFREADPAVFA